MSLTREQAIARSGLTSTQFTEAMKAGLISPIDGKRRNQRYEEADVDSLTAGNFDIDVYGAGEVKNCVLWENELDEIRKNPGGYCKIVARRKDNRPKSEREIVAEFSYSEVYKKIQQGEYEKLVTSNDKPYYRVKVKPI